jgi:HPt (histidine-containing phosphotransfer) domain-containing protein
MSSHTDTREPLDPSQIELLLSLDDGEGEALTEIVNEYLSVSDELREEILRLVGDGDCDALERSVHTLKGASANVGATALVDLCADLERRAREAQLANVAGLVEHLEGELERVRDALQVVTARA